MDIASPHQITCPFVKARYYRDLRQGKLGRDDWETSIDEIKMPELIGHRYHGFNGVTKLSVAVAAGRDSLRTGIPAAHVFPIPELEQIWQSIRDYQGFEERLSVLNDRDSVPANTDGSVTITTRPVRTGL